MKAADPSVPMEDGSTWGIRARGEDIRRYLLDNIEKNSTNIAASAALRFGISRQAVSKHLRKLVVEKILLPSGNTRNRAYRLAPLVEWSKKYQIDDFLAEDQVWSEDIVPLLGRVPENVLDIWQYCFTEMFNNAIDHSGGSEIVCAIGKTATSTQILLNDDGVGIFKKIQAAMKLLDERHAILELSKGKLTTDPSKHTGQGIFFTSRLLDSFDILSGGVFFTRRFGAEDWILERPKAESGTSIFMKLDNHTSRTAKKIFDQYSLDEDYGFNKTVVPVRLGQFGNDKLVSRSQAKRVLARVDLFTTVVFDFARVETIGQSFADEIFRVFALSHPQMSLLAVNATAAIQQMVDSAISQKLKDQQIRMAQN